MLLRFSYRGKELDILQWIQIWDCVFLFVCLFDLGLRKTEHGLRAFFFYSSPFYISACEWVIEIYSLLIVGVYTAPGGMFIGNWIVVRVSAT